MTLVGLLGIFLSLMAASVADLRWSRTRIALFTSLLILHTSASGAYYLYAEATGSDATFYYYDTLRIYGYATGLGTAFILNVVQYLKANLGGTFFDHFLLFQALGFWGIIFLTRIFYDIYGEVEIEPPTVVLLLLFLPGLHFWTGAIGKDAPLFLGVALSIWAAMRLNRRYIAYALATMLMLMIRPHIAVLSLMALALSVLIDKRVRLVVKLLLIAGVVGGATVMATTFQSYYQLDVTNADSVTEYMATRATVTENSGADMSIVTSSLPMKLFTLWCRPFFYDAEGAMGYIVSIENAVLMLLFGILVANWRLVGRLTKRVLFVRYSILLFVSITFLIALVNFNVGLGLRQKMMAMPCLLAIVCSVLALRWTRAPGMQVLSELSEMEDSDANWPNGPARV